MSAAYNVPEALCW